MSQISPPVRILLVGAVLLLAAWFTVLRPKSATVAAPAATATAEPSDAFGRAVAKAKGAVAQSDAASRRDGGESSAQPQTHTRATTGAAAKAAPAQPPIAIPAKVLATLPKDVSAALQARKTVVLGVIADGATRLRPLSDDDRYVRNALRKVNRYDGDVLVKRVPAGSLVRYAPLVGDLHVDQTPSIVVIDAKLQGTVLAGYVDRISINQAIADARRAGIHPLIADPYLRTLNRFCTQYYTAEARWSLPTIPGRKASVSAQNRYVALEQRYRAIAARIPAPARWRGLKRELLSSLDDFDRSVVKQADAAKRGDRAARLAAGQNFDWASTDKLDARLDKLGVTSCVINRRS